MKKLFTLGVILFCLPLMVVNASEEDTLVSHNVSFIKTTITNGMSVHEEITEEEYNEANTASDMVVAPYTYVETNYKRLDIYVYDASTMYRAQLYLTWKILPSTRSYDVIALRAGSGLSMIANSQSGSQKYYQDGQWKTISYAYNGTNINVKSNGYGISMNMVDDSDITGFEMYTTAFFEKTTTGTAYIYGSYQHATSSVTLAQSKNYTISAGGLGQVIYFYDGIDANYDNMSGVYTTF